MPHLTKLLILALALGVSNVALASDNSPFHNSINPYDVDDDNLVTEHDLLLIVNELQAGRVHPQAAVVDATNTFFWDTNNSGYLSPIDGLLVVNYLMVTPAPEPSSMVLGGAGLVALAGYCLRRRRRRRA